MFELKQLPATSIPMALLLLADPNVECIQKYLEGALCFAAVSTNGIDSGNSVDAGEVIAAAICQQTSEDSAELFNIAVSTSVQGQGIGSRLLSFVLESLRSNGVKRVELGTGTFGYQLAFYQRAGFRAESIIKDFFIDNYSEPVVEMGIQHKDMLRLVCEL